MQLSKYLIIDKFQNSPLKIQFLNRTECKYNFLKFDHFLNVRYNFYHLCLKA